MNKEIKCNKCGYATTNNLVFCPRCGNQMCNCNANSNNEFKRCPKCGKEYIVSMDHCIQCGYKIESYIKRMNDLKNTIDIKEHSYSSTPHCPTCNSTNVKRISAASKAVGVGLFGIFSKTARSQFECKDCGYKW